MPADVGREHPDERVPPMTDGYMAHVDPGFGMQIFDIQHRYREANAHQHCKADDLG